MKNVPSRIFSFLVANMLLAHLVALFSMPSVTLAKSDLEYNNQKWQILMDLLLTEEEILKRQFKGKKTAKMSWRIMKLHIEKFQLIHQKENANFMKSSVDFRMKKGRKWFFRKGNALYRKIKKEGLFIIKRWPKFAGISKVHYALAVNTLNHNNKMNIKREMPGHLTMALRKAPRGSPIVKKSVIGLAEYYYNHKKYRQAVSYYRRLLKDKKDTWRTKHLFNLSWCYLKINKLSLALASMKESFALSRLEKQGKKIYISYEEQAIMNLPLFFAHTGKTKEGVRFIRKEVKYPTDALIKMAHYTKELGQYRPTLHVYNNIFYTAQKNQQREDMLKVMLLKLGLFREFKRANKFLKMTQELVEENNKKPLPENVEKEVTSKIKSYTSFLQRRYHKSKSRNEKDMQSILSYFHYLTLLNPTDTHHYHFYQGETLFGSRKYKRALSFYKKGVEFFKTKKDKNQKDHDIIKKTFDSIFASLNKSKGKKNLNESIYAYTQYLAIYPVEKRSNRLYQRLFNAYYKQKKFSQCEKTLESYIQYYPYRNEKKVIINPDDHKKQQLMLTQLLDDRIAKKDIPSITYWIKKLQRGHLEFKNSYILKAKKIRSEMILTSAIKEKDLLKANKYHENIYENEQEHSRPIRVKAAYHIGANFVGLFQLSASIEWFRRAVAIMGLKEKADFQEDILNNVQKMVYAQNFSTAHQLAALFFQEQCLKNRTKLKRFSRKGDFYNASVIYALMAGDNKKAYENFEFGKKCGIKGHLQIKNLKYMTEFHVTHREYQHLDQLYLKYKNHPKLKGYFVQILLGIYWEALLNESLEEEQYALKHLKKEFKHPTTAKKRGPLGKELRAAVDFHQLKQVLARKDLDSFPLHTLPGKFNEKHFNKNLKSCLAELKAFTTQITAHINTGYPQIVTYGHQMIYHRYHSFGKSLLKFKPLGVQKHYKRTFQQTMRQLANQFLKEAQRQRRLALSLMKKEKVLLTQWRQIDLGDEHIINKVGHRHPASFYVLTLDRGQDDQRKKQ